jgi:hypothetical protein
VVTSWSKNSSESCPQIKRLSQGEHIRQAALATKPRLVDHQAADEKRDLAAFHERNGKNSHDLNRRAQLAG